MTRPGRARSRALPRPDRSAWLAQNVLPHEAALRSWLCRRRVVGLEIDDIVQETYAILATLPCVEHITAAKAYTFQTANSLILRQLRRGRIVQFEAIGDVDDLTAVADDPSAEQQVAARQYLREVLERISTFPPKCREAFLLRRVEGLSQREISKRMGISESTVEKHIRSGLRTLMAALARQGSDDPRLAPTTVDFRPRRATRHQAGR